MPKASPIQNSLNAGEFSPLMYGRTDFAKYKNGLKTCLNNIPLIQGGLTFRPGTRHVASVKYPANRTALLEFEFSTTQAYVIEVGDQYLRFYKDNGQITETALVITAISQANPAVVTIASHGFSNGNEVFLSGVAGMTEVNGKKFIVANQTANTFELAGTDSSSYTAYASGGTAARIYEISTPYLQADLFDANNRLNLRIAQSADVLYLAHPDYAPQKLTRTGHTSWTLTEIAFDWVPFLDKNLDDTLTVTASAITGSGITLTASNNLFTAAMVGGHWELQELVASEHNKWTSSTAVSTNQLLYYLGNVYKVVSGGTTGKRPPTHTEGTVSDGAVNLEFQHPGRGYAKITAYTSPTVVTATVIKQLPASSTSGTWRHAEGAWSPKNGHPQAVTFYADRLVWGGTTGHPQSIWLSQVSDYENHKRVGPDGTVTDDAAMFRTLNADDVNAIKWMLEDDKGLLIGTTGGPWLVQPVTALEPLSPTNAEAKRSSKLGAANVKGVRAGNAILFLQKAGRKIRELAYQFDRDKFVSASMSDISQHITYGGLLDIKFQQEPNPILWAYRTDGTLVGMTYERDQEVIGWHRHVLGGVSDASGTPARVEALAIIPSADGTSETPWLIAQRYVNGEIVRHIEYLTPLWEKGMSLEDAFFVDGGLTYDGSPATIISGLDHMEGEVATVLADGATHPVKTVVNGSITLERSSSKVHIGWGYNGDGQTLSLEAGSADGTAQGKTKRIHSVKFRLYDSLGISVGPDFDNLDDITFRTAGDPMDAPPPLFSGDKEVDWDGDYETESNVCWRQSQPLPLTVLAIMPQVNTQDR